MNKILLTGGSGLLGKELQKYIKCDAPPSYLFDITNMGETEDYDLIIHAAAYTDVPRAEIEKEKCFEVNVEGTYNLRKAYPYQKFVYISSEYAHNPVNYYSWTKLAGEEIIKTFPGDHLIIRTLFKPSPFPYDEAFFDQYTQGDYVDVIAPRIAAEILKGTKGTKYIGTGRKTIFELARRTVPDIKAISIDDIRNVKLPKDYEDSNSR